MDTESPSPLRKRSKIRTPGAAAAAAAEAVAEGAVIQAQPAAIAAATTTGTPRINARKRKAFKNKPHAKSMFAAKPSSVGIIAQTAQTPAAALPTIATTKTTTTTAADTTTDIEPAAAAMPSCHDPILGEALQAAAKRKPKLPLPKVEQQQHTADQCCDNNNNNNCAQRRRDQAEQIIAMQSRVQELQEQLQEQQVQNLEADLARLDALEQRDSALSRVTALESKVQKQRYRLKDQKKHAKQLVKDVKKNILFNRNTKLMLPSDAAKLTNNDTNQLAATDIYKHDVKWQSNYYHLKHFYETYGHTNFSQHLPEHQRLHYPPTLHHWVSTQRTQYRKLKAGDKTTLTPYRIQMLQQIQFEWQPQGHDTASFEMRLEQLEVYRQEHGNLRVPQNYAPEEHPKIVGLGNWVLMVRRKYRQGILPQERIDVLDAMGFEWKLRHRTK